MANWAHWMLKNPTTLWFGANQFLCKTGVLQGDPCSPFLFAIALTPVIEKLASLALLKQLWYLDDGLLFGTLEELTAAVKLLEEELPLRGLCLNRAKCELLTCVTTLSCDELRGIPILSTTTDWGFLGAPLTDEVGGSVTAATARALEVTDKLAMIAEACPLEVLCMLRFTAGACKVEHICKAASASILEDTMLLQVSKGLRKVLQQIVKVGDLSTKSWQQAFLPTKLGGLGIRDPLAIARSARLASIINCKAQALRLEAELSYIQAVQSTAEWDLQQVLSIQPLPPLQPSVELQKTLSNVVYSQQYAVLVAGDRYST